MAAEGVLQRREPAVRGEAFDGLELAPVRLHGEEEARAHGDAVQPHRARAADAVLAADVGTGEPERVAEKVGQEQPRLDELPRRDAVHGRRDLDHAAFSSARRAARATSTLVAWRR